jgi:hypothetical protein
MRRTKKNNKPKFDRRRALDCKLLEKSKNNPGYFKYEVTIGEKDGTVHKEPAYGRDMQDAISRLIWKERTFKIEKKMSAGWVFVLWLGLMGWPAVMLEHTDQPRYILYMFGGIALLVLVCAWWYSYINNKD